MVENVHGWVNIGRSRQMLEHPTVTTKKVLNFTEELYSRDLGTLMGAIQAEESRRTEAERIALRAGCGLTIHTHEQHTDYYLDYSVPKGAVDVQLYSGA
jgi:hypothetical protein